MASDSDLRTLCKIRNIPRVFGVVSLSGSVKESPVPAKFYPDSRANLVQNFAIFIWITIKKVTSGPQSKILIFLSGIGTLYHKQLYGHHAATGILEQISLLLLPIFIQLR
jgi:hypothetical protein